MSSVNITGISDSALLNEVYRLFTTPAGSVPFDRDFGIDMSVLEDRGGATEGLLMVEYTEKLLEYFPGLSIDSITFDTNGDEIIPTVVISSAGEE